MTEETKKELEELEKQLLADEEWFKKELDSAKRMIGQMPAKAAAPQRKKAAPGSTPAAKPQPRKPVAVEEPPMPKKGIKGLVILAILELLGILGLGAYWVLFLL